MPTLKSYVTGFVLSVMLTLAAYFAVVNHMQAVIWLIVILALIQLLVQLIFFLHLGQGADSRWNLIVLFSTFGVVCILVLGSLWIMQHLNYNMTPGQMNEYMMKSEGMTEK